MLADYTTRFIFALTVGSAIGLVGLVNVLILRWRGSVRLGLTCVAAAVPLVGLSLFQPDGALILPAIGVVACVAVGVYIMGLPAVVAVARHRSTRWGGLVVLGILAVIGAGIRYDRDLDAESNETLREIEFTEVQPDLELVPSSAATDRGQAVLLKRPVHARWSNGTPSLDEDRLRSHHLLLSVIRLAPAGETSNCHGWVFTGGKYWIGGLQVGPILDGNGYRPVSTAKVGDLVVYRDAGGGVSHTAVVRATPDGLPVLVESKWGRLGVFLHMVDKSPYGTDFSVYHSSRSGHLLIGIGSPSGLPNVTLP